MIAGRGSSPSYRSSTSWNEPLFLLHFLNDDPECPNLTRKSGGRLIAVQPRSHAEETGRTLRLRFYLALVGK